MHKVVSNTTPILSLLKIGHLELLKDLYSKEKKLIPSIKNLLNELSEKGTWIHPKLMDKAIKMAKE